LAKDVYVHSQKAVDIKQFANGNANDGSSIIQFMHWENDNILSPYCEVHIIIKIYII